MRFRTALTLLLGVLIFAGAGYAGWRYLKASDAAETAGAEKPPKGVPVRTDMVRQGAFEIYLNGLGTVEALNTVTIKAQITGKIVRIAFKEGGIVRQGDLLAEIDRRPFEAALDQAKAKLAQDNAALRDAQNILDRFTKLAQQQITSRQELDTQTATANQLTAQVAGDQAAVETAQTQLSYTTIHAPITGRVGFRLADVGNLVGPSDTAGVVVIQQIEPIAVIFTAPESDLQAVTAALQAGAPPVNALKADGRTVLASGSLRLVDNAIDAASGTVRLKAVFPNDDSALWPGQSVTTRLLVKTEENATIVDENAIQHGPDGPFVFVVGGDKKAELRKVAVAQTDGGKALVTQGLKAGEEVVVEGQYRVAPDALLEPKRSESTGKIAAAPADREPARAND